MDPYNTSSGTVEAPRIRLEVPIMCAYMKSMLISTDFGSMGYASLIAMITQHALAFFKIAPDQLRQFNVQPKKSDTQIQNCHI